MIFEQAVEKLFKHEGYISDDPTDSGGLTQYGISQKAYPDLDIRSLTKAEAAAIYKKDYWDKCRCDELPDHIRYSVFDFAVNGGVSRAIKTLQSCASVKKDGIIGANTLEASKIVSKERYALERMFFYCQLVRRNQSQAKFLGGWSLRTMDVYNA